MNRLVLLFVVAISTLGFADDLAQQAQAAYAAKDWAKAQVLYAKVTAEQPQLGLAWFRLGESHLQQRHYRDAVGAFEKARQLRFQPGFTAVKLAAAHTGAGETEKAIEYLEKLAQFKPALAPLIEQEPAFRALAGNARFEAAKRTIQIATTPCKFADVMPEARQFDFWIGEWDVFTPQGVQAGTNRIERILGDCVILENWTDRLGSQGKSFNKYHTDKKRWEQYWVDEQGTTTHFWGQLEGKNMVFHAEAPQPDGKMGERKLIFFNLGPDKLRQFSQITTDGGKTWTTEYDLTYVRRGTQNQTATVR
ncbi:MAG: tetratricopeptide repeat protein [Acidobacteriales bacterium]|nr:tetratricopeptide repeat protein [Terriglobales bacterium]